LVGGLKIALFRRFQNARHIAHAIRVNSLQS
jgi:hypothetical protein